MIRLETANTLLAADTPTTGRDALTKGVDMDQPTELVLPILPFLVQVFPTPGKETIPWGGFLSILRRRGVPGHRSRRLGLRHAPALACTRGEDQACEIGGQARRAGKGWSVANIGSGANFASNPPACAGCTGMVLGTKPLRVKVTLNGPSAESSIEHGVRQPEPSDAVASAPCGLEFKWMVALTDLRSGAAGISPDDWCAGVTSSTMVDLGELGSSAA